MVFNSHSLSFYSEFELVTIFEFSLMCVCVCVGMFMWFMRTQICIMTWV